MRINLTLASDQARQAGNCVNSLINAKDALQIFNSQLQAHWRGEEVQNINIAINNILSRLASSSSELNIISSEIIPAAQEVRRQEDLADANAILAREDATVANLRRAFENAQHQHSINPTLATQMALNTSQTHLNNAIRIRNDAAARVRALMR